MSNRRHCARRGRSAITRGVGLPWADFNAAVGVTLNAGAVESWDSGSTRVSQSTASSRPVPATGINGRSTISFDGTDDHLLGGSTLADLMDQRAAYSLYVVGSLSGALSSPRAIIAVSDTVSAYSYHFHLNTDGHGRAGGSSPQGTQSFTNTTPYDYACTYDGLLVNSWVNGAQSINNSSNIGSPMCTTFSVGALILGGSAIQPYSGHIGRIVIYPGVHTGAQRRAISSALRLSFGM